MIFPPQLCPVLIPCDIYSLKEVKVVRAESNNTMGFRFFFLMVMLCLHRVMGPSVTPGASERAVFWVAFPMKSSDHDEHGDRWN